MNAKPVLSQIFYQFQTFVMNEDGSVSANIRFGTLEEMPSIPPAFDPMLGAAPSSAEPVPQYNFKVFAQQGHHLNVHEVAQMDSSTEGLPEGATFRELMEFKIEKALIAKGAIPA
jgi:hypothetical protein